MFEILDKNNITCVSISWLKNQLDCCKEIKIFVIICTYKEIVIDVYTVNVK